MDTGTIVITEDDDPQRPQQVAIYARVSAAEDRPNLNTQTERLLSYSAAKGYQVHNAVQDVGSGMNDNRRKLLKLLADPTITVPLNTKTVLPVSAFVTSRGYSSNKAEESKSSTWLIMGRRACWSTW